MARGQERFNIYCTPCHSRVGNGEGMIVQRGYKPAGNFHDAKRLAEPLSHYFYVMTNGYGAMPDYSAQIAPEDRWAIAAYIRALQYSQSASVAAVPSGVKVDSLADIAASEGYDASFAQPWVLPQGTNVQAIQPGQTPAVGPSAQPAPKIQTHPATKTPMRTQPRPPPPAETEARNGQGPILRNGYAGNRNDMAHATHLKTLPADLNAPAFVSVWRTRALTVGAVFGVIGVILAFLANDHFQHLLRSWLLGFIISWGFSIGGMALLMVQYLSGGKWGLLVRRPLEAMSRTLPLVFLFFLPVGIFAKQLYIWAKYPDAESALKQGFINADPGPRHQLQETDAERDLLLGGLIDLLAIWAFYTWRLNKWSLQRDQEVGLDSARAPKRTLLAEAL